MITERALSPSERAVWLMDQAVSLNGMMVAHVRGPLSPEALGVGLSRLQERHPMLRAHIEPETWPDRPTLRVARDARPIPVRVVPRLGPETWHVVAEEELNRRFLPGEDPLWRAVLVQGRGESEVLLPHHHVLADATSVCLCVRDLLRDAAALHEGTPLLPVDPLPLRPALSDLLSISGPRMLSSLNSFLWRQAGARLRGGPHKLRLDRMAPPAERRSRLLHHTLSPSQTAALSARCRQEQTTVHGAMGAALLLAVACDMGHAATVGCFSTISLRDRLSVQLGDEVGLFVSQATTFHRLIAGRDLWGLAREFRQRLVHAIDRGEPYMTFPWLGMFVPRGKDPLPGLLSRVDLRAPFAVGISNAGRLPLSAHYGPLHLYRLHIAIGMSLIAPIVAGVTTLDGTLCCNLLYAEPLIDRERALRMGDHMMTLLR